MTAVVQAAHAAGRKVVAHASHRDAFLMSLDAGVDVVTHVPMDAAIDPPVARRMADEGRIAIPTLVTSKILKAARPSADASYDNARASVVVMHEAGVQLLAGTDSVDRPGAPFSIPHGSAVHDELDLLVDAGLTPVEALRAATSGPAAAFGFDDRGAVRAGLRADLLLVDGDPTADIGATGDLRGVWIAGERVR